MRKGWIRLLPLAVLFSLVLTGGAAFAGGAFTVSGVHVSATATSATEARKAAIAAGRAKAWVVLYRRLVSRKDWDKQPQLGPVELQRLIASYYPEKEKRSTTRYAADITYNFKSGAVSRMLRGAGLAFASAPAEKILLIPFSNGYAGASDWGAALADPRFTDSFVPFRLPSGDAADLAVLKPLSFASVRWADLAPLAARYSVHEIVLVQALRGDNGAIQVRLRHLSPDAAAGEVMAAPVFDDVPGGHQGAADAANADPYAVAADAAVAALENMWKQQSMIDFAASNHLTADVKITSLKRFAALRARLKRVPNVADVALEAMDLGAARLRVTYMGSAAQLQTRLARAGIQLTASGNGWQLGFVRP